MELVFLGSGSAFTIGNNNYQSNMLLIDGEKKLLIDCGTDIRHSLHEKGYSYKDITDVYISHLHTDHVGGIEWLALTTHFDKKCSKPNLYLSKLLVENLWNKILVTGLSSLEAIKPELSTFFNVYPIPLNGSFTWQDISFQLVQTVHAVNQFSLMPSFGLIFSINNTSIFITSDTQFCPQQIMTVYQQSDIIFQDCEISDRKATVHATYSQLKTLEKSIKAKMWLYHYDAMKLPDAKKDGFLGFVKKGQIFKF